MSHTTIQQPRFENVTPYIIKTHTSIRFAPVPWSLLWRYHTSWTLLEPCFEHFSKITGVVQLFMTQFRYPLDCYNQIRTYKLKCNLVNSQNPHIVQQDSNDTTANESGDRVWSSPRPILTRPDLVFPRYKIPASHGAYGRAVLALRRVLDRFERV